jgi:8-oxo-dGTP pyrophosphatase MutT (NUDIX family)
MSKVLISTQEAKQDKLFYVVSNVVIIDPKIKKCLLLKRSLGEKVLPGKWVFPGGKLEHKDVADLLNKSGRNPIDGVNNILSILAVREANEECGLEIDEGKCEIIKDNVFIRPDGIPVFFAILSAVYQGGNVKYENGAFTEAAWVGLDEIDKYDCPEDIPILMNKALSKY